MSLEAIVILALLAVLALWGIGFGIWASRVERNQKATNERLAALELESHSHAFFGSKPKGTPADAGPSIPPLNGTWAESVRASSGQ